MQGIPVTLPRIMLFCCWLLITPRAPRWCPATLFFSTTCNQQRKHTRAACCCRVDHSGTQPRILMTGRPCFNSKKGKPHEELCSWDGTSLYSLYYNIDFAALLDMQRCIPDQL